MKITQRWLESHIAIDSADIELINKTLHNLGFPIAEFYPNKLGDKFKIAKILEINRHPNADRLSVCQVTDDENTYQIVCGAQNLYINQHTVLALPGAVLPSNTEIKISKIRGVESYGMMCSGAELGIETINDGILDLNQVHPGMLADESLNPEGAGWNIEVTFNRSDMLSVRGIARELAAGGIGKLQDLNIRLDYPNTTSIIKNELSESICPLVVFAKVNLTNISTPDKIKKRLAIQSSKSHTLPVDVTNYIMYDIGQPMHSFDADKVQGQLIIRLSYEGEEIELLSSENIKLQAGVPVIADDLGLVSIIGVMGGARTACTEETKVILLEALSINREYFREFAPKNIDTVAKGINIDTVAKGMFMRGVDRSAPIYGMNLALDILKDCGASVSSIQQIGGVKEYVIDVDEELITKIIGHSDINISTCLERLDIKYNSANTAIVPPWRYDVHTSHDLAEEVARIYGYNNIGISNHELRASINLLSNVSVIANCLAMNGLHEILTSSLINPTPSFEGISILNSTKKLRESLIPGLLQSYLSQTSRRIMQWVGIFEIGSCFKQENQVITQSEKLAVLLNAQCPKYITNNSIEYYFDLICDLTKDGRNYTFVQTDNVPSYIHPNIYRDIYYSNSKVGYIGALNPSVTYPINKRKEQIYVLEMKLPDSLDQMRRCDSSADSQSWRDITLIYNHSPRHLYTRLKNVESSISYIDYISQYNNALTFRIWISSSSITKEAIDQITQKYIDQAVHLGATLQS